MSTAVRPARSLAILVIGFSLAAAGLGAAASWAFSAGTTVTVRVQNASSEPISGLNVSAHTDGGAAEFRQTGTPGEYQATGMDPGNWTIAAYDGSNNQPYIEAQTKYAVHDGDNVVPAIRMDLGAVVSGKVTSPSGRALKDVLVTVVRGGSQPSQIEDADDSNAAGLFEIKGLEAGTYSLGYVYSYNPFVLNAAAVPARTLTAGQVSSGLDFKAKVPATMSVSGKSASTGKATLTASAHGKDFGITDAGGAVTIKDGTKTIKSNVKITKGVATINFSGLKKGNHYITVTYAGGDLLNTYRKITLKVK